MTDSVVIWHNPRCSKSRETLKLLQDQGYTPTVRRYLDDPPGQETLEAVVRHLGGPARDLVRAKESDFKALGLDLKTAADATLIDALANNPRLIERPVVIFGGKAVIGRPPESVLALFERSSSK